MRNIRVASVQFEHASGDKQANLAKIKNYVIQAAEQGVELIEFPECCITGYWFLRKLPSEELKAEVINLSGGIIDTVESERVHITQGGANRIVASEVELLQGGAATIHGETVHLQRGAAIAVRGGEVSLEDGNAGAVVADGLSMTGSRVGVVVAGQVEMENSNAVILLARDVHGSVETVLDTRGALLAGLVSGICVGLVLSVFKMLSRRS